MGAAVPIRDDIPAEELRRLARQESDGRVACRLLGLANVRDQNSLRLLLPHRPAARSSASFATSGSRSHCGRPLVRFKRRPIARSGHLKFE
jgi:hypothetical protein